MAFFDRIHLCPVYVFWSELLAQRPSQLRQIERGEGRQCSDWDHGN